jgi:hypothetical protein
MGTLSDQVCSNIQRATVARGNPPALTGVPAIILAHAEPLPSRGNDPRQHARERRANARRLVSGSRLQSLSGPRRERLPRRCAGAIIRPEAAVRGLRASWGRCEAELE